MPTEIDPYSLATVPVTAFFRDQPCGQATGSVWLDDGAYLVTNWHVVTGCNSETGECMRPDGCMPDRLVARFLSWDGGEVLTWQRTLPLYDDEGAPLWFWHPVYKHQVDVVALKISGPPPDHDYRAINKLPSRGDLWIRVAMDIFILGYPFTAEPPWLPVWKGGTIASEPQISVLAWQYFLVDSATRKGMSGSPVLRRSYGAHLTHQGPSIETEPATKLLGVYSGRLKTSNAEDAQLGRVFPTRFVEDIIQAQTRDSSKIGPRIA